MAKQLNRIVPAESTAIEFNEAAAVVYVYTSNGAPCARAFAGKSSKPAWAYRFRNEAQRDAYIAEWVAGRQRAQEERRERMAARNNFTHSLNVGDIVVTCWGWEQTNREFFEVVRVVSGKSVEVREISGEYVETGFMSGHVTPCPGNYIGEPAVRRVRQGNVVVNAVHGRYDAYPWEGKPVYESHYA